MIPSNGYLPPTGVADHTLINSVNPTIASYNGIAMGNNTPILNHGINPLAPSITNSALNLNGVAGQMNQSGVMQQQQSQQQPAYFVQQAVYVDQNGQPIYYRTGTI